MGGGSSKPRETGEMVWLRLNLDKSLFKNYLNNNSIELPRHTFWYNSGAKRLDVDYQSNGPNTYHNSQQMLEFSFNYIINKIPEHGNESNAINNWKEILINLTPRLIERNFVRASPTIKALLDQLFDIKLIDATKRNLDGDINVQIELIKYYYDTYLKIYPINSQFIGILGGFNKSILYYEDPKLTDGYQKRASVRLRGYLFFILVDKIGRAFRNKGLINNLIIDIDSNEIKNLLNSILYSFSNNSIINTLQLNSNPNINKRELRNFFNMCVKVIEDKPLNKYGNGDSIKGLENKQPFTDSELAGGNIFDNVESLKGACKFALFLYRKNTCYKYIMNTNARNLSKEQTEAAKNLIPMPDADTYRSCKIIGVEPIKKPDAIVQAENSSNQNEGFEQSFSKSTSEYTTSETFLNKPLNIEKFNIFTKIENNLKLILGYVIITVIIGILIFISPAVFKTLYTIIKDFIIPAIQAILPVIGDTLIVMTKLISTSFEALFSLISTVSEGTFNILSKIFSIILDLVMVFIKFGADGISGVVFYVINQLSTLFKIITEGGYSILELTFNLFSSLAEKIFNYIKKFYMSINNIEGE